VLNVYVRWLLLAMIFQSTGVSLSMEPLAELLPAMEQTLWELQPLPANPGNLTAYSGSYWASIYGGYLVLALILTQCPLIASISCLHVI
jgi:hypothetical protein